ncbi:beta-N-acetyl-D-glucosaminide beta-1 4-N-acetylglucosaminyl-transferase-like isoform X1 [Biomphalaria glabrata]|nr:beta-N-acetyl-D-glucosaminide beta-1; 4-N-acetylglucosaminyl-transferase-like isoform X1 [Biomphalaria glabrata]KAI8750559.1 beta-N-acetyl-D-glucosaminide beta-1,4-N-acetylglucosaminyl-transferase isoform X1 [Biomphalaria glabrata]
MMNRTGNNCWVSCWRTSRKYHIGTIFLGITFVTSVAILANITNMRAQVNRSFLSFTRSNESLAAMCSEYNEKMAQEKAAPLTQVPQSPENPPGNLPAQTLSEDKNLETKEKKSEAAAAVAPGPPPAGQAVVAEYNVTSAYQREDETTIEAVTCDLTKFKKGMPVAGLEKNSTDFCPDKPATLFGRFEPAMTPMTMEELSSMFPVVQKGGHYSPRGCKPVEKTLLIIPYRNRCSQLYTLLPVLISMLIRQNINFSIYVIEQITPGKFNKGVLFNSGFLEAAKRESFDCVILHDVDMVPVNDLNMYRCNKTGPTHFSAVVSKYKFKLLYSGIFGGVVGFTKEHFQKINGASNAFFGWGAEDDDLRNRAHFKKLPLLRKREDVGVYYMVKHKYEEGWEKNPDRLKIYAAGKNRQNIDGLNSVKYKVVNTMEYPMFTWIGIEFNKEELLKSIPTKMLKGRVASSNFYDKVNFITI